MISDQKQSQLHKYGFSFIEVIITITIIGILTAVTIPNYSHYLTKNNELLVEQQAIVIQEEIFERMVYLSAYGSVKLPFVSNSNYGGVGVMDISDFTITFATYQLLVTSSVLDYDNSEEPVISSVTELNSVGWEVVCCMPYETGESVYIYFEVRDDPYEYHDTMYVKKMSYVSADNIEIEKNLKL